MFQRAASRTAVTVPMESIAGVQGEDAERFEDYQDERPRIVPVTHCWTPAGDVLVGCKGGQLLRVCLFTCPDFLQHTLIFVIFVVVVVGLFTTAVAECLK